jgi:hypothetical protein
MILLRFILFFILFYLLVRFIGRLLFGYSQRSSGQYRTSDNEHHFRRKEGDVNVEFNPENKDKKIRKEDGEYINYEEIKD